MDVLADIIFLISENIFRAEKKHFDRFILPESSLAGLGASLGVTDWLSSPNTRGCISLAYHSRANLPPLTLFPHSPLTLTGESLLSHFPI